MPIKLQQPSGSIPQVFGPSFSPPSSRMHDRFPSAIAEGIVEILSVMEGKVVSDKRLSSVLVYSLQYLHKN